MSVGLPLGPSVTVYFFSPKGHLIFVTSTYPTDVVVYTVLLLGSRRLHCMPDMYPQSLQLQSASPANFARDFHVVAVGHLLANPFKKSSSFSLILSKPSPWNSFHRRFSSDNVVVVVVEVFLFWHSSSQSLSSSSFQMESSFPSLSSSP